MKVKYACYTGSNGNKYCYLEVVEKMANGKYKARKRIPFTKDNELEIKLITIFWLLKSVENDLLAAKKKLELAKFLVNADLEELKRFTQSYEMKMKELLV